MLFYILKQQGIHLMNEVLLSPFKDITGYNFMNEQQSLNIFMLQYSLIELLYMMQL